MGPAAYKEIAEHAGYQRAIINRNPPLIDEDGYDIDSEDDEEQVQEAIASALEENPYSSIRLERTPMTSSGSVPESSADFRRNSRPPYCRHRPAVTSDLLSTVYFEIAGRAD
jgi:hypothetical protein